MKTSGVGSTPEASSRKQDRSYVFDNRLSGLVCVPAIHRYYLREQYHLILKNILNIIIHRHKISGIR